MRETLKNSPQTSVEVVFDVLFGVFRVNPEFLLSLSVDTFRLVRLTWWTMEWGLHKEEKRLSGEHNEITNKS